MQVKYNWFSQHLLCNQKIGTVTVGMHRAINMGVIFRHPCPWTVFAGANSLPVNTV